MAGKMKGSKPRDFQKSTTERTMTARLAMPRLPTPMAMRDPGLRFAPKCPAASSRAIVPGRSRRRRSGKFWWTVSKRENGIIRAYNAARSHRSAVDEVLRSGRDDDCRRGDLRSMASVDGEAGAVRVGLRAAAHAAADFRAQRGSRRAFDSGVVSTADAGIAVRRQPAKLPVDSIAPGVAAVRSTFRIRAGDRAGGGAGRDFHFSVRAKNGVVAAGVGRGRMDVRMRGTVRGARDDGGIVGARSLFRITLPAVAGGFAEIPGARGSDGGDCVRWTSAASGVCGCGDDS